MDSVIGANTEAVLSSFLTNMPLNLSIGKGNRIFNSVLIEVAEDTGNAISITRIDREIKE